MKIIGKKPLLTAEQAAYVREVEQARKAALAQFPTRKQLADRFGVKLHTIANAAIGLGRKHHDHAARAAAKNQGAIQC